MPWLEDKPDPLRWIRDKMTSLSGTNGGENPRVPDHVAEDNEKRYKAHETAFQGCRRRAQRATDSASRLLKWTETTKRQVWAPAILGGVTILYCAGAMQFLSTYGCSVGQVLTALAILLAAFTILLTITAMYKVLYKTGS